MRNDVRLRAIKPGKKIEMYDETLYSEKLYRIAQLLIGIQSENYDKAAQTDAET